MTSNSSLVPLSKRNLGDFGFARARDSAFDAVQSLWRRRQAEGMKQTDLAAILGRDEGWVSRSLSGPANWTLRTLGELVSGLGGEVQIFALALEDPPPSRSNYDAYKELDDLASETATANSDYRQTWDTGAWQPDVAFQGSDDQGNLIVEIKRR